MQTVGLLFDKIKEHLKKIALKILESPKVYKVLYESYNYLQYDVLKLKSVAIQIASASLILLFTFYLGNIALTAFVTLCMLSILFITMHLLRYIIKFYSNNNGNAKGFIFPGKHIIIMKDQPCKIVMQDIPVDRFELATENTARICAELNEKAFKRSVWGADLDKKMERNLSHIKRNKYSIMLIKSADKKKCIGFTHILAVNESNWNQYLNGKVSDNNFPDWRIVPEVPTKKDHQPYGLILFSSAITERVSECEIPKDYKKDVGLLIEQAITYHASLLLKGAFKETEVVHVLFQNMSREFLSFFKDAKINSTNISKDGARIIVFNLNNDL